MVMDRFNPQGLLELVSGDIPLELDSGQNPNDIVYNDISQGLFDLDTCQFPGLGDFETDLGTPSSPDSKVIEHPESFLPPTSGIESLPSCPSTYSPEHQSPQDDDCMIPRFASTTIYRLLDTTSPWTPRPESSLSSCLDTTRSAQGGHVKNAGNAGNDGRTRPLKAEKRSITSAFSEEELDMDNQNRRARLKTSTTKGDQRRDQSLACPFYMRNPHKHQECLKYALRRVKDVKQHVYRRHKQPDYYCARCSTVFKTMAERDEHIRCADCNKLPMIRFEGISEDQRNMLNKSSCRTLDIENQWFEMWDILFPGEDRPVSAFVGSYTEEMVPLLRNLWENRRDHIMGCVLDNDGDGKVEISQLNSIMDSLFDSLEVETSESLSAYASGSEANLIKSKSDADIFPTTITPEFDTASDLGFDKFLISPKATALNQRNIIEETKFTCPVCKKNFTRKISIKGHIDSHNGLKPFPCPERGRGFTRTNDMVRHQKIHSISHRGT